MVGDLNSSQCPRNQTSSSFIKSISSIGKELSDEPPDSIFSVPSAVNCGCSAAVTQIFCLNSASPSRRLLSRRCGALSRRNSYIRKSVGPSYFRNYEDSPKTDRKHGFGAPCSPKRRDSIWKPPSFSHQGATKINFDNTYRGYAAVQNEQRDSTQNIIPEIEEEISGKIGTTRWTRHGEDSLGRATHSPAAPQHFSDVAGNTDENNNPVFSLPLESKTFFSISRKRHESNSKNTQRQPPAFQLKMPPFQASVPEGFSPEQQFIVMPAMFSAGYRPKLRIRRRSQQNNNGCTPSPCCCPQNNFGLFCQGKKVDDRRQNTGFLPKNNEGLSGENAEQMIRSRATSTARKRMSTPIKEPSPAACCFCVCQMPYMPPTTPQDNTKTGASPYKSPSFRTTADENVQSFTPIKSTSTSSTAIKKEEDGSSGFFAQPSPSPPQFQPNDGGRPLSSIKSKSDPYLQMTFESELRIEPQENIETNENTVMTGTRGKFTSEQLQQQRKDVQVEQIYPKPNSETKKPVMADQGTSYSREGLEIKTSIRMGPPSTVPPFSEATTVNSFPVSGSPQTGSSPPPPKSGLKLHSSLKSSHATGLQQKSQTKSARFKSIAPRNSDDSAEVVPASKKGSYRRPTAFVPSGTGSKRQGAAIASKIPEPRSTMQQQRTNANSTTSYKDQYSASAHNPQSTSSQQTTMRQQSNQLASENSQKDTVLLQTSKSLINIPQKSQQLSVIAGIKTAAPSNAPSFLPPQNPNLCITKSGNVRRKLSYETVCRPANESFYGGPYEDPSPFGGRSHAASRQPSKSTVNCCKGEKCSCKTKSGTFGHSGSDPNANFSSNSKNGTENPDDVNEGRPASLPTKSEPKPPALPPKPAQKIPAMPLTKSRFPGGWNKGRGHGGGHLRKKRLAKKKDSDSNNGTRSPSTSKGHDVYGGGQNSMFPFGCLPLGPMVMPQINAREGTVILPSALKCQKVCFAPGAQIATTLKSSIKNAKNYTMTPMTLRSTPMNNQGLPAGLSPFCVCPNFQTNPGSHTLHGNMRGQTLNGLTNGQSAGTQPTITIIPGMVYAPPGAANQVYVH